MDYPDSFFFKKNSISTVDHKHNQLTADIKIRRLYKTVLLENKSIFDFTIDDKN